MTLLCARLLQAGDELPHAVVDDVVGADVVVGAEEYHLQRVHDRRFFVSNGLLESRSDTTERCMSFEVCTPLFECPRDDRLSLLLLTEDLEEPLIRYYGLDLRSSQR